MLAAEAMKAMLPSMPYHQTVARRIQRRVSEKAAGISVKASGTTVM